MINAAWLAPPPVLLITVFLGSTPLSITHTLGLLCCFFGHCFEVSSFHIFLWLLFSSDSSLQCGALRLLFPHTHAAAATPATPAAAPLLLRVVLNPMLKRRGSGELSLSHTQRCAVFDHIRLNSAEFCCKPHWASFGRVWPRLAAQSPFRVARSSHCPAMRCAW